MKKVTDSYIQDHIKKAVVNLVPNQAENLWKRTVEKAAGDEWYLDGLRGGKVKDRKGGARKVIKYASSLAACLALCLLTYYMVSLRVEATVYLDVNPSVALDVNRRERVLQAKANNADGQAILKDMDLKNTDLDVAVNAILGSMVRHGYLNEEQRIVLLSVEGNNRKKAEDIRGRLSGEISICMDSLLGSGTVLDQEIHRDNELEELAGKYGISMGKAALLQKLCAANPGLDLEKLTKMSIRELAEYLEEWDIDLEEYVNYTGRGLQEEQEKAAEDELKAGNTKEEKQEEDEEDSDPEDEREEDEEDPDPEDKGDETEKLEAEQDILEEDKEGEEAEDASELEERDDDSEEEMEEAGEKAEQKKEDKESLAEEKREAKEELEEKKEDSLNQERIQRKMENLKRRMELLAKEKEAQQEEDRRENQEESLETEDQEDWKMGEKTQPEYEPELQYDAELEYEPEPQYDAEPEYEPEPQYDVEPEYEPEPEYEADEGDREDD